MCHAVNWQAVHQCGRPRTSAHDSRISLSACRIVPLRHTRFTSITIHSNRVRAGGGERGRGGHDARHGRDAGPDEIKKNSDVETCTDLCTPAATRDTRARAVPGPVVLVWCVSSTAPTRGRRSVKRRFSHAFDTFLTGRVSLLCRALLFSGGLWRLIDAKQLRVRDCGRFGVRNCRNVAGPRPRAGPALARSRPEPGGGARHPR